MRDGVRVFYEVYGDGPVTVVLLPTDPLVHSRVWRAQIPYLARHHRVIAIDPRGNGKSDRPTTAEAYADREYLADSLAVLDVTGTERAVMFGHCTSTRFALELAVEHPQRVLGVVGIGGGVGLLTPPLPWRADAVLTFDEIVEGDGWAAKENRHFWLRDYRGWIEAHSGPECMTTEPHSSKVIEDLVGFGMETDAETLLLAEEAPHDAWRTSKESAEAYLRRVRCRC